MECIKTEPTIALEDSLMHVFQLKPDPDIFFQHVSYKNNVYSKGNYSMILYPFV